MGNPDLDELLRYNADAEAAPLRRGVVSDRAELDTTIRKDGMQRNYLVLSEEERAKGFVRPVRESYRHVGIAGPRFPLRDLDAHDHAMNLDSVYAKFEVYPQPNPDGSSATGRYWSQADLDRVGKGCQQTTTMGRALAETYARQPTFYGATFCATCRTHLPVGADGEFVWAGTDERVGA